MIERVWLIADADTNDASYVQHGQEGDEANWSLIGPFAYTHRAKAEQAARNPKFFPEGAQGRFTVLEVEGSGFVQAIFNGFPPSNTDVFMLDEGLYPLTHEGARWVDEALEVPVWLPLFDQGVQWLDRVLEQVAGRLHMSMETVLAIGSINAQAEDAAADVEQSSTLVSHNVRLLVIPEEDTLALDEQEGVATLSPAAKFVIATTGLSTFGLPELEFRDVPAAWVQAAGLELKGWAVYALDKGICVEDTLPVTGPVHLEYEVVESTNKRWGSLGVDCLQLVVRTVEFSVTPRRGGDPVH